MITVPRNQLKLPVDESPSASSYKKSSVEKDKRVPDRKGAARGLLKKNSNHQRRKDCSTTPADGSTNPVSRSVHFAKTAKVKKVRSRQHYTWEERDGMWHTTEEYNAIKRRALATLKVMVYSSNFTEDDNHTARGLESRTKEASMKRKEFKSFARELVLEEQENQREAGVKNPERLRKACQESSSRSHRQAREIAEKDHEAVRCESLDDILAQIKLQNGRR